MNYIVKFKIQVITYLCYQTLYMSLHKLLIYNWLIMPENNLSQSWGEEFHLKITLTLILNGTL